MWRAVARHLAPAAVLARGCRALSAAAIGPGAALGARAGAPGRGPALGGSARRPRGLLPAAGPRVGPSRCCSLPAHQKVRGGPATFPSPSPAFLSRLRSLPSCPFPSSFPLLPSFPLSSLPSFPSFYLFPFFFPFPAALLAQGDSRLPRTPSAPVPLCFVLSLSFIPHPCMPGPGTAAHQTLEAPLGSPSPLSPSP